MPVSSSPRPRKRSRPGGRPSRSIPTSARRSLAWRTPCDRPIAPSRTSSWRATSRYRKQRRILDSADTLANNGVVAASAHDWPEATRQLKAAIAECGDCAMKADLFKKLGLIDCQAGDLDDGEKELLAAKALKPADLEIQRALQLIAEARNQHAGSAAGKAY